MSDPICTACNNPCDVISLDFGIREADGYTNLGPRAEHVSFCCKATYRVPNLAEQIQRETLAENAAQRGFRTC